MKKNKKSLLIILLAMIAALAAIFAAACAKQPLDVLEVTSIEIETPPSKTVYTEGDTFNPEGMKVIAYYEDSSMSYVEDYTFTPSGELSADDKKVVVSYKGKSASVDITVNLKVPDGAVEKTYRFEAECCDIQSTPADDGKVAIARDQETASGGQCLEYVGNAAATTLTFNIYSDSKANAVLFLNMGRREKVFTFNSMFDLTINGEAANPETDVEFPVMEDGIKYYDWYTAEVSRFILEQGDNTIVMTKKGSTINLDYIEIKTVAELEWKTEHDNGGHTFGDWNVSKQPSFSDTGLADRWCLTCRLHEEATLPAISSENYNKEIVAAEEGTDRLGVSEWAFKDSDNLGLAVTVETDIKNIVLSGLSKKNYVKDEELDLSGLTVTVVYACGDNTVEKEVTDYTVSKEDGAVLAANDTVTVTWEGITVNTGIFVTETAIKELKVEGPAKKEYYDDEKLNTAGLKVKVVYYDDTEEEISEYTVIDEGKELTAGEVKFVVEALGATAEFSVTVTAVELQDIEVDGSTVTAKFNKGDEVLTAEDYSLTLNQDKSKLTVSYIYKGTTKTQEITANTLRLEAEGLTVNDVNNNCNYGNKYETYHNGETSNISGMGFIAQYTNNSTIIIKVNTDKAALVKLIMAADCNNNGKSYAYSRVIPSLKVGEETVEVNEGSITGIDCFTWQQLEIATFALEAGETVITIEIYDVTKLYVDYFEIIATEAVTNADEADGHEYSDWTLTKYPTETETGRMYRYCGICQTKEVVELPVLGDSAYTEVASAEATDSIRGYKILKYTAADGNEYTFTMTTAAAAGDATDYELVALTQGELNGLKQDGSTDYVAANQNKGTITFRFNLSEKATVKLAISSTRGNAPRYYLADWARVYFDNKAIALDDTQYLAKKVSNWFEKEVHDVAVFELEAGEHTVVMEFMGMPSGCFYGIVLTTAATVTDSEQDADAANIPETAYVPYNRENGYDDGATVSGN